MPRITIVEGIYQDAHGISIVARIGTAPNILRAKPVRFPLIDRDGIPYSKRNCGELIKCRLQLLEDLRRQRARAGGAAGSLGAAIDQWKAAHPIPLKANGKPDSSSKIGGAHALLTHWRTAAIAAVPLDAVKRSAVREQLAAWLTAGHAASSCNHRKRALGDVLRWSLKADDDADVMIATDGIERFQEPEAEARGIEMPILAYILAAMPDRGQGIKGETRAAYSATKIRLRVMAWTGLAHGSLKRLTRRDVNFREGKVRLPMRHKGKGASGVWVDALTPALDALRDYDRANLWGRSFSNSSMWKSWQRALDTARGSLTAAAEATGDRTMLEQFVAAVPVKCRPYDTRHSFLSDAYRQTGDIRAVQELGQHRSLKTTERYTKAAVPERVANAVAKIQARWFPDAPKPAATVREFHLVTKS